MDVETAQLVLVGITGLGAVVWVAALNFLSRSARPTPAPDSLAFREAAAASGLIGGVEVDGQPRELAARAAAMLIQGNHPAFGPIKVLEKSDDHIVFGPPTAGDARRSAGHWFRRVELRFTPVSPARTRVEWLVEPANLRWFLQAGVFFLVAGLVALTAGCFLMHVYVASSPDPAVRWQTLQMFQAVHFLWPPFLFGGLYRRGMHAVPDQLEALANNLSYLKS